MENTDFKIKVGEFEGPLDLLLNLIEKRKMHISDVSLAAVADDYVAFMSSFQNFPMGEMANFILVASTLMLIKSSALLPGLNLTTEEQTTIEDLESRLKHYEQIKKLSLIIKERFGKNIIFSRETSKELPIVFSPTTEINPNSLWQAMKKVLVELPKKEIIPEAVVRKVISLEEVITDLAGRIQKAIRMPFSDYVKDKKEKVGIIVSFLGMLELVKQGIIDIRQDEHFSDISMETNEVGVPRY